MKDIKFVSYDGKYPCLCFGKLILEIDGKKEEFESCMRSGGSTYFTNDYQDSHVESGAWTFNNEREDISFTEEEVVLIEKLINENVTQGCCGGCL